ncbi:MAG: hypothetical protein U9Q29_00565 [Campylobacterota bacterium]|nr:hypothetical protein [Campylobacterota bacterium]
MKTVLHAILLINLLVLFTACGYKPSAKYSRAIVGDKISTTVRISAQDPENTVIIKDAVDEAIIEVFHASLTSRALSTTHLELSISDPSYAPTQYNDDGYVVGYRTAITLSIVKYHNGLSKSYSAKGTYDFSIAPNAIVSDQERFEAIKFSSAKAIKSFLAQVSAEGARAKKE